MQYVIFCSFVVLQIAVSEFDILCFNVYNNQNICCKPTGNLC